jgi:hypothetical protein
MECSGGAKEMCMQHYSPVPLLWMYRCFFFLFLFFSLFFFLIFLS